jgi:hypothetical protein
MIVSVQFSVLWQQVAEILHEMLFMHLIYSLFRSTQPWLNVAIATTARDYRKFEEQR